MNKDIKPKILFDADVVIHFSKGGQLHILNKIFPNRFVMLDKVKAELSVHKESAKRIDFFLTSTKIEIIPFPKDRETLKEYSKLKDEFGDGETARMAVAKHHKKYIASSNLKDIKAYCILNKITFYTTMDLLLEAISKKILSEAECNIFIAIVINKGSKLPCDTIQDYIELKASGK
jgi:predicted nucleic acid-binding protein